MAEKRTIDAGKQAQNMPENITKQAEAGSPGGEPRLEFWAAERLKAHPLNMRTHPANQRAALDSVMERAGWAGAVIVNERTGHIIDGHLRAERALETGEEVPVLLFDLPADREHLALATHDALARWAEGDLERYSELSGEVTAAFDGLGDELAGVMAEVRADLAGDDARRQAAASEAAAGYWVSVECGSEAEQKRVYEKMKAEGRGCRVLTV